MSQPTMHGFPVVFVDGPPSTKRGPRKDSALRFLKWKEHLASAESGRFLDEPIAEMTRDELLIVIGYQLDREYHQRQKPTESPRP